MSDKGKIEVKLVRSLIGRKPNQRKTVRSLGLGKIGSKRIHDASPSIMGMITVVRHLVSVTPAEAVKGGKNE